MYKLAIALLAGLTPIAVHADEPMELHYSRAGDGYSTKEFHPTTAPNPGMITTVVSHPSRAALRAEAKRMGATDPDTLAAFSARTVSGSRCTVHVVDQSVIYEPEQVGHEMLHCFYGSWHDESFRPVTSRAGSK